MGEVKVEVVGRREVIKPASPSPRDRLQLSLFDLYSPAMYVPTVFFYKTEDHHTPEIISKNLKTSLSETLSRFYPFAGRMEGVSINCNDEGVVFTEARTDLLLHDFLRNLNTDYSLERFSPTMAPGDSPTEWPLLSVKVTFFGSGSGVAVSVSGSHRICDGASFMTFITDWAATTTKRKSNDTITFAETTIYPSPPPSFGISSELPSHGPLTCKCVINRFVFESSKITELKCNTASESVPVPSRVEAVSALIWKCARNASLSNLEVPRSTLMSHAIDLRPRIPTNVLSRDAVGNLETAIFLKEEAEKDLDLREIVAKFRKAKEKANNMIEENLQGNTLGQYLSSVIKKFMSELKPDIDIYIMSSWCRKSFYEVDFGWGSPVWIGYPLHHDDNVAFVVLIDSKDGKGVEAWIALPEQDMPVLLRDQDFLVYAVLNPPVLI